MTGQELNKVQANTKSFSNRTEKLIMKSFQIEFLLVEGGVTNQILIDTRDYCLESSQREDKSRHFMCF